MAEIPNLFDGLGASTFGGTTNTAPRRFVAGSSRSVDTLTPYPGIPNQDLATTMYAPVNEDDAIKYAGSQGFPAISSRRSARETMTPEQIAAIDAIDKIAEKIYEDRRANPSTPPSRAGQTRPPLQEDRFERPPNGKSWTSSLAYPANATSPVAPAPKPTPRPQGAYAPALTGEANAYGIIQGVPEPYEATPRPAVESLPDLSKMSIDELEGYIASLQKADNRGPVAIKPKTDKPASKNVGTLRYLAEAGANLIPRAIAAVPDTLIGASNLGWGEKDKAPYLGTNLDIVNQHESKGFAQGAIELAQGLGSQLPVMLATGGLAEGVMAPAVARGLLNPTVAKAIGSAASFGLPASPGGLESMAIQGLVGAGMPIAAARGVKTKLAIGASGGGLGYYEGERQDPGGSSGLIAGGMNALFPTAIDPLIAAIGKRYRPVIGGRARATPEAAPRSYPEGEIGETRPLFGPEQVAYGPSLGEAVEPQAPRPIRGEPGYAPEFPLEVPSVAGEPRMSIEPMFSETGAQLELPFTKFIGEQTNFDFAGEGLPTGLPTAQLPVRPRGPAAAPAKTPYPKLFPQFSADRAAEVATLQEANRVAQEKYEADRAAYPELEPPVLAPMPPELNEGYTDAPRTKYEEADRQARYAAKLAQYKIDKAAYYKAKNNRAPKLDWEKSTAETRAADRAATASGRAEQDALILRGPASTPTPLELADARQQQAAAKVAQEVADRKFTREEGGRDFKLEQDKADAIAKAEAEAKAKAEAEAKADADPIEEAHFLYGKHKSFTPWADAMVKQFSKSIVGALRKIWDLLTMGNDAGSIGSFNPESKANRLARLRRERIDHSNLTPKQKRERLAQEKKDLAWFDMLEEDRIAAGGDPNQTQAQRYQIAQANLQARDKRLIELREQEKTNPTSKGALLDQVNKLLQQVKGNWNKNNRGAINEDAWQRGRSLAKQRLAQEEAARLRNNTYDDVADVDAVRDEISFGVSGDSIPQPTEVASLQVPKPEPAPNPSPSVPAPAPEPAVRHALRGAPMDQAPLSPHKRGKLKTSAAPVVETAKELETRRLKEKAAPVPTLLDPPPARTGELSLAEKESGKTVTAGDGTAIFDAAKSFVGTPAELAGAPKYQVIIGNKYYKFDTDAQLQSFLASGSIKPDETANIHRNKRRGVTIDFEYTGKKVASVQPVEPVSGKTVVPKIFGKAVVEDSVNVELFPELASGKKETNRLTIPTEAEKAAARAALEKKNEVVESTPTPLEVKPKLKLRREAAPVVDAEALKPLEPMRPRPSADASAAEQAAWQAESDARWELVQQRRNEQQLLDEQTRQAKVDALKAETDATRSAQQEAIKQKVKINELLKLAEDKKETTSPLAQWEEMQKIVKTLEEHKKWLADNGQPVDPVTERRIPELRAEIATLRLAAEKTGEMTPKGEKLFRVYKGMKKKSRAGEAGFILNPMDLFFKPKPDAAKIPEPTPDPTRPSVARDPQLQGDLIRLGMRGLVGGTMGGVVGANSDDISIAQGILVGGVLGLYGPKIAKGIAQGDIRKQIAAARATEGGVKAQFKQLLTGGKTLDELGREGRYGWNSVASATAKLVRWLEEEFKLNLDPTLEGITQQGAGIGALHIATMQDALNKSRWFKPNAAMEEKVGKFLTGKITRAEFVAGLTGQSEVNYGNFITTARDSATALSRLLSDGMADGPLKKHIIKTADSYLGKFYEAHKSGKFNEEFFEAAKSDYRKAYPDATEQVADATLREYAREIQATRTIFGGRARATTGQSINTSLSKRRLYTEAEVQQQQANVDGMLPSNPQYKAMTSLLEIMDKNQITDSWSKWMGEITNPTARLLYSIQKLHASSMSSKIYDLLDNSFTSDNLKFAMTQKEIIQIRANMASALEGMTPGSAEFAKMQNRLNKLDGYGQLPEGFQYGKLSGKFVDRFVRDEINTYSTPYKWMEQPIIRGISEFNNVVKIGRTALNPVTVVRNYFQMPLMGLIAGTKTKDVLRAFKEVHSIKGEVRRELLEQNVIGADFVSNETNKGVGYMFSGQMDADITTRMLKYGLDKALELYSQPDTMLRAGTYLGAKDRIAARAVAKGMTASIDGVPTELRFATLQEALAHPAVKAEALYYTNRYTMNYSAVPKIVKVARSLPFINLFISYASEITRITKNLVEDAITPNAKGVSQMHAVTTLAAMAAIPPAIVAAARSNFSDKELADWDQVRKLQPAYLRNRFLIPTGVKKGQWTFIDFTNLIPHDNMMSIAKSVFQGDPASALAANPIANLQNTPLLNLAASQIAGQDLRTGREYAGGLDRAKAAIEIAAPPLLGYEGRRIGAAFTENNKGTLGLTNIRSGVETAPEDIVLSYLTGLRSGGFNLEAVKRARIGQAQREIKIAQQKMRDTTNTNANLADQKEARALYAKREKEILDDLTILLKGKKQKWTELPLN